MENTTLPSTQQSEELVCFAGFQEALSKVAFSAREKNRLIQIITQFLTSFQEDGEDSVENLNSALREIQNSVDSKIFEKLGQITRRLHDTINGQELPTSVTTRLREVDVTGVSGNILHVTDLLAESANNVLNLTEKQEAIYTKIDQAIATKDFSTLEEQMSFLKEYTQKIITAQSFQDITGQILKKVVTVTEEVEGALIEMIQIMGKPALVASQPEDTLKGPSLEGCSQDDVDDLLKSFGF
jgi:chemotaxis protein CheZ